MQHYCEYHKEASVPKSRITVESERRGGGGGSVELKICPLEADHVNDITTLLLTFIGKLETFCGEKDTFSVQLKYPLQAGITSQLHCSIII